MLSWDRVYMATQYPHISFHRLYYGRYSQEKECTHLLTGRANKLEKPENCLIKALILRWMRRGLSAPEAIRLPVKSAVRAGQQPSSTQPPSNKKSSSNTKLEPFLIPPPSYQELNNNILRIPI